MARRRYRSDAISTAGQAAQPRDPSGDTSLQQPLEPKAEYGKGEPAQPQPAQPVSGLGQQLHDMRQQAQNDALEQYISAYFGGATANERAWLRANVHHLQNPMLVHHAAGIALQRGVPRESPEFLHFVGQLLDQHAAAQMQPAPAPPMPAPPLPPMPAHTHVDLEKVESGEGEPEEEHMAVHHVSAPVSRGEASHTMSIEPQLTPSQVRLTPEERELCAINKIDETKYAEGKLRLAKQKAARIRD
jgi:hypothetical protein